MRVRLAIAALTALLAFGSSAALGSGQKTEWRKFTNGVVCQSQAGGVACVKTSGSGYGVAIHKNYVLVMNLRTNKVVFKRFH